MIKKAEMKILVVGDHRTGTGPAEVTKAYIERLGNRALFLRSGAKALRAMELCAKLPFCKVVLCSGYSAQNILAAKLAHLFSRKCVYLMHGSVEHEDLINRCPNEKMNRVERETLRLSDRIYAVSAGFSKWLSKRYPEYSDKIEPQVNGVDITPYRGEELRDYNKLLTVGGGMPRKRINRICTAVSILRAQEEFKDLELIVIGNKGADSKEIDSHPFVKDLGTVNKEEANRLYRSCGLFIQNSCFETFGLAPMEAMSNGCDMLLSKEIGALELFDKESLPGRFIIENCEDPKEIAEKIKGALHSENVKEFERAFSRKDNSWEKRTEELLLKLGSL